MGKGWTDTGHFTIVSNYVLEDIDLSSRARFLYTLLVRYGRWKRVEEDTYLVAWVSRPKLSELMAESEWTVSQHVRELIDRGLIERRRRPGGSSLTYICDPRSIYADPPDIPEDEAVEHPDTIEAIELANGEEIPQSLAPAHDVVCQSTRRPVPEHTTDQPQMTMELESVAAIGQTAEPDKDVGVEEDIAILSDDSRASLGTEDRKEKGDGQTGEETEVDLRVYENRERGILARRSENKLTTKSKPKIGVPSDELAVDDGDPETARELWREFQRVMLENHPGYSAPEGATARELGNCRKLLNEYEVEHLIGLFKMVATRWMVIREKWPTLAKTPLPTFYVAFTLRRELVPLVQSGKGLTSRTHRVDEAAKKPPSVGWGDE